VKHEFLELIPPTLYFFVILHIVALIRALMTRNTGIDVSATTSVTVGALILGKSVLLANALPFINRYPEKPWVWNVCWKTRLYFLIAVYCTISELARVIGAAKLKKMFLGRFRTV